MKIINETDLKGLKSRCKLYNHNVDFKDSEYGIWEIKGEDTNPDFGGFHHSPTLGYAKGCFIDVLVYATTFPDFYTWGGGGYIVKSNKKEITDVPRNFASNYLFGEIKEKRDKLNKRKNELLSELEGIDKELKGI